MEQRLNTLEGEVAKLREFKHEMPSKLMGIVGPLELDVREAKSLLHSLKDDIAELAKQGQTYLTKRDLGIFTGTIGFLVIVAGLAIAWMRAH